MKVALLTVEQADQLKGVEVTKDNLFNPIQDINGNWVISVEEQSQCSLEWVKELPLIDYSPKTITLF